MKIVETIYTGHDWVSGEDDVDRRVEVAFINDDGEKVSSVSIGEGEPEDMKMFRDLNDAYSIMGLVEGAYELGRSGTVVSFESNTEEL